MKTHTPTTTTNLVALLAGFACLSFLVGGASAADGLAIRLKANGQLIETGTVIPVQPDFEHPDGKNGLAFEVNVKALKDTAGQLRISFLSKAPVIPRKSVPYQGPKQWTYQTQGTLTSRVDVKKDTEFTQTFTLWLKADVTAPYGTTQPVGLVLSDDSGVVFEAEVSFQVPAKP